MKILFVCRGNVGRSQMAEALFKQQTTDHEVLSAGTRVVSKTGESRHGQTLRDLMPAADNVILALRKKGIEAAENTRTQLDEEMVSWADIIVTMAEPNTAPDYLANSLKAIYWDVKDPKETTLAEHESILQEIEVLIHDFIEKNNL